MRKSIMLLVSWLLVLVYMALMIMSISKGFADGSDFEKLGTAVMTMMMYPHLITVAIGLLFNILGWALHKPGYALTCAILYTVGMVLFPFFFFMLLVQTILSYVAYAKMKREGW